MLKYEIIKLNLFSKFLLLELLESLPLDSHFFK